MKKVISDCPIPISGLMLSIAALGNLVRPYGDYFRNSLGILSFLIFIVLVLKLLISPSCIREGFSNPIVAGVMATFPMTLMIFSTYLTSISTTYAFSLWLIGIALHIMLIIAFTNKHLAAFKIDKVFPTHFIVYVGIVCASVASPAHQMQSIGQLIFWFGFMSYLFLLPIVVFRIIKYGIKMDPAKPTFAIISAPASLCLAGYFSAFPVRSQLIVNVLAILAIGSFLVVLVRMLKLLRLPFYPSYSAYTFPFVITAIAIRPLSISPLLKNSVMYFAIIVVAYVLLSYLRFLYRLNSQVIDPELA